jgi:hypothetical protein
VTTIRRDPSIDAIVPTPRSASLAEADAHAAALELLAATAYSDGSISEVIRPAAIVPELASRDILAELAMRDVRTGGQWFAEPSVWRRYERAWAGPTGEGEEGQLIGTLQVAYGTPTRYDITIYRATITGPAAAKGWTVTTLCNEVLAFGQSTLDDCPRADSRPPPKPFRLT